KRHRQRPVTTHTRFQRLPFNQLHCVETLAGRGLAEVKYAGHIWMPQLRSCSRFTPKALTRVGITRVPSANYLERDRRPQVDVDCTVRCPHGAAPKFLESDTVCGQANFIVLEAAVHGTRFTQAPKQEAV